MCTVERMTPVYLVQLSLKLLREMVTLYNVCKCCVCSIVRTHLYVKLEYVTRLSLKAPLNQTNM